MQAQDGRRFEIVCHSPGQHSCRGLASKGSTTATQAEALNGTELFTERAALPEKEEGEFFHDDLVGLGVLDETGATIGKVTAVQNFGGGDILELQLSDGKDVLIPFTHAAVPDVDVGGGLIRDRPPCGRIGR